MSNNTKILIIHNYVAPYRHHIFEQLSKKYPRTIVVFLAEKCPISRGWDPYPRKYHYPKIILTSKRTLLNIIKNIAFMAKIILSYDPHVIIVGGHTEVEMKLVLVLSKILGKKCIYWTESNEVYESTLKFVNKNFSKLFRIMATKIADAVIVPGKLSYISERKMTEKVFIVPNSIDEEVWLNSRRSRSSMDKHISFTIDMLKRFRGNSTIFIYVGRLNREKGIIPLIAAFMKILNERRDSFLVLIGDGPLKAAIKNIIEKKGLTDNIVLMGSISDLGMLSEFYKLADVVILPTLRDVWGFVINEAALLGNVIISSKFSQAATVLLEGTPLLLEKVDVKHVYNGIRLYLDRKEYFSRYYRNLIKKRYKRYLNSCLSGIGLTRAIEKVASLNK